MKSICITVILSCMALAKGYGQKIIPPDLKEYTCQLVQADLKSGAVKILLRGGIAATYEKGQEIFESKYGLHYYEYGCVVPLYLSLAEYNKTVGLYLDSRYGREWRKELRKNVPGLSEG